MMESTQKYEITERVSFLQLLRLFFVLFSLYLLRETFNRWDGFSYYASFSEFIPTVALVTILWTIVGVIATVPAWILFRLSERLFDLAGLKIRTEHFLFYGTLSVLFGASVWKIKRLLWPEAQTSVQLKIAFLVLVVSLSAYVVWAVRDRLWHWFRILQERITPLVWLFGFLVVLSIPLVGYSVLKTDAEKPIPTKFTKSAPSKPGEKRPNILLVIFDTLTARDMSLYGYDRETTPFISEWAKDAAVFTRLEAVNNHTTPSTASLMTGKQVWTHQVYHQWGSKPVRSDVESLPKVLKDNGYFNLAFVVNSSASTNVLGLFDSFDVSPLATDFFRVDYLEMLNPYHMGVAGMLIYKLFGDKIRLHDWILKDNFLGRLQPFSKPLYKLRNPEYSKTPVPPEAAFKRFLEIYDDLPEPFFAWIHVFPPHALYLPPEPYRGMFGPYLPPERYMIPEDDDSQFMLDMRILYDEFIRYCDSQFEDFITRLEAKDKENNTVVILSSDHGESFQHDVYQHAVHALYEQLTHVPLVIKTAGQSAGLKIDALVSQIDIPATILELADIQVPGWMEGRSLVPYMRGESLPPLPLFSAYLQGNRSRGHEITTGLVAVWEDDYKLIYDLQSEKKLLFNLRQDPEEMNNLTDSEPEIGNRLLEIIKTNLEKANERIQLDNRKD